MMLVNEDQNFRIWRVCTRTPVRRGRCWKVMELADEKKNWRSIEVLIRLSGLFQGVDGSLLGGML